MKKLIKIALSCFLCIGLVACTKKEETVIPEFTITIFYLDTCGHCSALKSRLVPKIEEEFGDKVTIEFISADNEENMTLYDQYTGYYDEEGNFVEGKLKDFNQEYIGEYYVPLVIVDQAFAFIGYDEDFDSYYIKDIKNGVLGKALSSTLDVDRWTFK